MNIAFTGIMGIPACYSGFETFVEKFAEGLVRDGYLVTVYNRQYINYKGEGYNGIRIIILPTIKMKHLDTIFHTFLSVIHCLFCRYDIVYVCGVGNSPLIFIPRLVGSKVIINVDGLDWSREKWSPFAKLYLKVCEVWAIIFANVVITDSRFVQSYYRNTYSKETVYISYGAQIRTRGNAYEIDILKKFGLEKDKYILFISRLVPENGAHILIEAYNMLRTDLKLVIAGNATYSDRYIESLKSAKSLPMIFTGFVFGQEYNQLMRNAYIFVLPSMVSGTRVVLLEAMAFSNCVLVNNCESNMEVVGDAGYSYNGQYGTVALRDGLQYLIDNPDIVISYRQKAVERIKKFYSLDEKILEYKIIFSRWKK